MISVIIPVYNVEPYLADCLRSVVQSDLAEIEIIAVDDGSTDGSDIVLQEFAARDSRIRVVTQTNQGLPAARNRGLMLARGEFVAFLDSDDWVDPEMYSTMVSLLQGTGASMAVSNITRVYAGSAVDGDRYESGIIRFDPTDPWALYSLQVDSCCNKVFRTDMLRSNSIIFEPKVLVPQEDFLFLGKCLTHLDYVVTTHRSLYNYRLRAGSITNAPSAEKELAGLNLPRVLRQYHEIVGSDREIGKVLDNLTAAMAQAALNACRPPRLESIRFILKSLLSIPDFDGSVLRADVTRLHGQSGAKRVYWRVLFRLMTYRTINLAAGCEYLRLRRLDQSFRKSWIRYPESCVPTHTQEDG